MTELDKMIIEIKKYIVSIIIESCSDNNIFFNYKSQHQRMILYILINKFISVTKGELSTFTGYKKRWIYGNRISSVLEEIKAETCYNLVRKEVYHNKMLKMLKTLHLS